MIGRMHQEEKLVFKRNSELKYFLVKTFRFGQSGRNKPGVHFNRHVDSSISENESKGLTRR